MSVALVSTSSPGPPCSSPCPWAGSDRTSFPVPPSAYSGNTPAASPCTSTATSSPSPSRASASPTSAPTQRAVCPSTATQPAPGAIPAPLSLTIQAEPTAADFATTRFASPGPATYATSCDPNGVTSTSGGNGRTLTVAALAAAGQTASAAPTVTSHFTARRW